MSWLYLMQFDIVFDAEPEETQLLYQANIQSSVILLLR